MDKSFFDFILENLFVPGTAVGILFGMVILSYVCAKGWLVFGSTAKLIRELSGENQRLNAEVKAMKEKLQELIDRLKPWEEFEKELIHAARISKSKQIVKD